MTDHLGVDFDADERARWALAYDPWCDRKRHRVLNDDGSFPVVLARYDDDVWSLIGNHAQEQTPTNVVIHDGRTGGRIALVSMRIDTTGVLVDAFELAAGATFSTLVSYLTANDGEAEIHFERGPRLGLTLLYGG